MESGYQIIASISPRGTHANTPLANCSHSLASFPSYIPVRWLAKILFLFSVSQQLLCPCVSFVLFCAFALSLSLSLCTLYLGHVMSSPSQSLTALFPSLLSLTLYSFRSGPQFRHISRHQLTIIRHILPTNSTKCSTRRGIHTQEHRKRRRKHRSELPLCPPVRCRGPQSRARRCLWPLRLRRRCCRLG